MMESFILIPMVLPPSASGLMLLYLLSPNSSIGQFLETQFGISLLLSWQAAVCAAAFVSFPLLFKTVEQAFSSIPRELEDAAKTFGARPLQVFFRISLPLAKRGIIQGCILSISRSLGEFGATIIVAGNIPGRTQTLSLAIYSEILAGNEDKAWILATTSTCFAFGLLILGKINVGKQAET